MNTLQRQARLFHLVHQTTTLAEGVEWSDGTVTVRWRVPRRGTSTWDDGVEAFLDTQRTDDRTQLHWFTGPTATRLPAAPDRTAPTPTVWLPVSAPDGRCSRCGELWPCLSCGP